MNQNLQNSTVLAGRILLALIFVLSGFMKIRDFDHTAAFMANSGLPFTKPLLMLTIALELGGGILLMAGWQTRWVALAFFLWLIPVTVVFHTSSDNPAQAQAQMIQMLKNISIMGGMLQLIAFGAGAWSMDGRRSK